MSPSPFPGRNTVLQGCAAIVTGFHTLGRVKHLNISGTQVQDSDLGHLSRVTVLNLSNTVVADMTHLGQITRLDISRCVNVVDVAPLASVTTLNIGFCTSVHDCASGCPTFPCRLTGLRIGWTGGACVRMCACVRV